MEKLTYDYCRKIFLHTLITKKQINGYSAYFQYTEELTRMGMSYSIVPYEEFETRFIEALTQYVTKQVGKTIVQEPFLLMEDTLDAMIKFYNVQVTYNKLNEPVHYC